MTRSRAGRLRLELLELALRPLTAAERCEIARQARRVPPAQAADGRDGADADPEVVATEPVAEVVVGPQVAGAVGAAEVRGLVPAIAGARQRLDDALEVVLHRLGLPLELVAVGVGEARPRLRLELVTGEVLRLERDRLGEVSLEIGDALAGNAVDQVEGDVVEACAAERPDRAADVVGARLPLERLEQVRLEALRAERDAIDPVFAQQRGELGRDRLRIGLDSRLHRAGKSGQESRERRRLREGRRAAAEEDRLDLAREQAALELELRQQRVDVAAVLAVVSGDGDEVAVAAAVGAERQVDVEVARARSKPRDGGVDAPFWNGTRQFASRVCRGSAGFVPVRDAHFDRSSRLSTARNASCGTSTPPTCFIRFLPFFCFSSSFRLRLMSPP